jgi:hypothetical protein
MLGDIDVDAEPVCIKSVNVKMTSPGHIVGDRHLHTISTRANTGTNRRDISSDHGVLCQMSFSLDFKSQVERSDGNNNCPVASSRWTSFITIAIVLCYCLFPSELNLF